MNRDWILAPVSRNKFEHILNIVCDLIIFVYLEIYKTKVQVNWHTTVKLFNGKTQTESITKSLKLSNNWMDTYIETTSKWIQSWTILKKIRAKVKLGFEKCTNRNKRVTVALGIGKDWIQFWISHSHPSSISIPPI